MSDIEIAQQVTMLPIIDLAAQKLAIPAEHLDPYGHYKAKISLESYSLLMTIHWKTRT
jgi:formate--tetrahydrofolate ligase